MILTASQSIVLRDINPKDKFTIEAILKEHGLKMVSEIDAITRKSIACPEFVTRTTGCPNGCARPYMAEIAFVGSGPSMYEIWLGGSPAQSERTANKTSIFKMKYA